MRPQALQAQVRWAEKGVWADLFQALASAGGPSAAPNIPPKSSRRYKPGFSPALYRNRNAIERAFCRLKDFRRIATRYDKLAGNFLAAPSPQPPSATGYESGP